MLGKHKGITTFSLFYVYFQSCIIQSSLIILLVLIMFLPFSVIVYKSSQRSKKVRLQHFFTPDKSPVTSLVYKKHFLYVGLVSGSVAIYSRSQGASFKKWKGYFLICKSFASYLYSASTKLFKSL